MSAPTEPREGDFFGSLIEAHEYRLRQKASVLQAAYAVVYRQVLGVARDFLDEVEGVQRGREVRR